MVSRSSLGTQRSGTGSQMNIGRGSLFGSALRRDKIEVTRLIQRVGEQSRWKHFAASSGGVRDISSRRSLGVEYLKARVSNSSKLLKPLVVRREELDRKRHDVCHSAIAVSREAGKSVPLSTIQPTFLDSGGVEKSRAPRTEKVPPPPRMSNTGGVGGG